MLQTLPNTDTRVSAHILILPAKLEAKSIQASSTPFLSHRYATFTRYISSQSRLPAETLLTPFLFSIATLAFVAGVIGILARTDW